MIHICKWCHKLIWFWQAHVTNPMWSLYGDYDYFHANGVCFKSWVEKFGSHGVD